MSDTTANRNRSARTERVPPDLAAVVVATLLVVVAAFAPVIRETPLRVPVGIAFVLFVPGYALIAALFPERNRVAVADADGGDASETTDGGRTRVLGAGTGLDGVDRLSLSVLASVILVSTVGVAIHYTPWPIQAGPVVAVVAVATLLLSWIAVRRRRALAPSVAFAVPVERWRSTVRGAVRDPDSRADVVLTGLLVLAVGIALASVGFAAVGPGFGGADGADGHSALFLEHDGDLLTNESAVLETDDAANVTVGVENEEGRTVDYTVVAVTQQLEGDGENVSVANETELERRGIEVDDGDTRRLEYELESAAVDDAADDTRVVWLLYADEVPDDPSTETAEAYVTLSLSDGSDG
ncbi:Protein of unknown function DUF1616 [Haloterrigena turkmenica DSM 5511]|uniref:DUF1616 domain-containing protein n=1 Tax=Haloterrigena turkmenica (strain ATCC 51198 / DSM 5511 / JCM 9101 / NCIMB 13204 / VKM B-1734 / 4k) TaxID=543526 RepID=D2RVV6_HALTV|nr:DUF1616 domain-containing protein [Haloterrigena turkmenica]ADB61385.1 Protein of unknown function DUF1616 [Haloterrigena turkmenica DSM 5511]